MSISHIHFSKINSTSTYIKENYCSLKDMTFVSALEQSSGHGRNNRNWYSKKGENLLFSILIKDPSFIPYIYKLSLGSAYIISSFIEEKYKIKPLIKWPNDIYVDDKKICGILLESHMNDGEIDGIIIGIGINVNQIDFPLDLIHPATSLSLLTNKKYKLDDLTNELFPYFYKELNNIKNNDFFLDYIKEHNYLKNKDVYALINNEQCLIKVLDINDDGSLKILKNNEMMDIYSGEISFHLVIN